MDSTYRIPADEMAAFCDLPSDLQRRIEQTLQVFWTIDHTPRAKRGATWALEVERANCALAAHGLRPSLGVKTLYALHRRFTLEQDWTVLIDRRQVRDWDPTHRRRLEPVPEGTDTALPAGFIDYVRGKALRHNRSSEQALHEVRREWRAGTEIPGYGNCHEWWRVRYPLEPIPAVIPYPEAWSLRNLRRFMPQPAALALARRGVSAGLAEIPDIIRTRAGLRPLEYVVADDWRADFMVCIPGLPAAKKAVELHGILCADVATAVALRFGCRPFLPRPDGSHEGLKRTDTKSLFVDTLLNYGYPLDYRCTWIVENGTATITEDDAAAIEKVTGGQVRITWTSMISGNVFGWADRAIGNFRGKAWLESFINLLHNACGAIPGQIGAHYDKRPGSVPAMLSAAKALIRAQDSLPPTLRETLQYRLPFVDLRQAVQALSWVFHTLNNREEHSCEGFDQIMKVRLTEADPYRAVSELVESGVSIEALRQLNPRPIMESPAERMKRLCRGIRFQKPSFAAIRLLLERHEKVTVEREGEINLGSKSEPLIYRDRSNPWLKVGRKYLAWMSTTDDSMIHLTDGDRHVTSITRERAVSMVDRAALTEAAAAKNRQMKTVVNQVRSLNLNAEQEAADAQHNLDLMAAQLETQALARIPVQPVEAGETQIVRELAAVEAAVGAGREAVERVEIDQSADLARRAARFSPDGE